MCQHGMPPLLGLSRGEVRHECAGDVSSHGALLSAGESMRLRGLPPFASILSQRVERVALQPTKRISLAARCLRASNRRHGAGRPVAPWGLFIHQVGSS